jgi:HAD superfamily hydrolase (TIGR01490 family)
VKPNTPDTIALFDLDRTLLTIDADEAWVEFLLDEGALDRSRFEPAMHDVSRRYGRGEIGIHEFVEFYLSTLAPHDPARLEAWRQRWLAERIFPAIAPAARALVEKHRAAGHLIVMSTAASRFLTAPIAEELGIEHLIATEPQMRAGRYTGKAEGMPNMREGKIARLEAWLSSRGTGLDAFRESWFYSDSRNDIPLLSRVTHPVAVNADPTLAELARAKGWPQLQIR